ASGGWRDRRLARVGGDQQTAYLSVLQNPRNERQSRNQRLIVDSAAPAYHRSPILERIICKAEAWAEIVVVARRARRLQIVVVTQAEIQEQIRSRLHAVLQVDPEDLPCGLRVRIAEALIDRAREAETHLLDSRQLLRRRRHIIWRIN